jgi:large exoprotein involved in heme utilization and adhesion
LTAIDAQANAGSTGNAGNVTVTAGALAIVNAGAISSRALGPFNNLPAATGDAGLVYVSAGTIAIGKNGQISVSTQGSGAGGDVRITVADGMALSGGGQVTAATAGSGNGGAVQVTANGPVSLSDPGTAIVASASSTATGNAGLVIVAAPQIILARGAEIASTTAGTGAGGSVTVTTPGTLVLDGAGVANTQIAASATGSQSGPGGPVTVRAGRLTVAGGAQIASSTAGPGKGGDVNVTVASDIVLPDRGPQITAQSTGSGDAGSITVSAVRLLMNNGAAISTEADTSTASGGNITLKMRDFLYLVSSEITTSVKGETGNGGNITIDPQLVILNHSRITAEAIEGHGGNITINAGEYIASADSIVSATSQKGISGTVEIGGPRVDVNGALVVLSSELRGLVAVQREACAARADRPISSLVEAGRGGQPQDPEATLPALYIAGRDVNPKPQTVAEPTEASSARQTTVRLTMRCG